MPRGVRAATQKITDVLGDFLPKFRDRLTPDEQDLGIYLRGNKELYEALTKVIQFRIEGRAKVPEPSDPLMCKSMLARDRELQTLLSRLEYVYRSPVLQPADDGEQPA